MLTLLKHDLLTNKKQYITLFILSLCFFIVSPFLTWIQINLTENNNAIGSVLTTLLIVGTVIVFAIISVLTVIVGYQFLHNSLFSKQGYLTLTLPYKSWKIVLSKILSIIIYLAGYSIVIAVGSLIMYGEYKLLLGSYSDLSVIFSGIYDIWELIISSSDSETNMIAVNLLASLNALLSLPTSLILFLLADCLVNSNKTKSTAKKGMIIFLFLLMTFGFNYICRFLETIIMGFASINVIVPLIINSLLSLMVIFGGFKLIIYLLDYHLELV